MNKVKGEMAKITQNNIDTIAACRYCPMCRQSCPSEFISYRESDAPRGRAILLYNIYKGGKEYDRTAIEAVYNCFLCMSCRSWCEGYNAGGYDIPELIKFARRDIVEKGLVLKIIEQLKTFLVENNNSFGLDSSKEFTAQQKGKGIGDVLYLLGEGANYKNKEIAEAVISILDKAGINYTLLKNEPTSGKILDLLGYRNEALKKAKVLAGEIKATGCKTVVVSDPLDYDAFMKDYLDWGINLEGIKVMHVSQYIEKLIKIGKLKVKLSSTKVTLVDSEYLGRSNGVWDSPRQVIKSVAGDNYVEMQWHHDYLQPAGEAAFTFDDKIFTRGEELGKKISQKAEEAGAEVIVTLSATAKKNISSTTDIHVVDIAEYIWNLIYK